MVKVGSNRVRNLFQPVRLTFTNNTKVNNLTCILVGNEELFFPRCVLNVSGGRGGLRVLAGIQPG